MNNDGNSWSNNPYQANAPLEQAIPVVDKPTSMVVFGILNLVWGALGLMVIIGAMALQVANLPKDPNNPMQELLDNPTYQMITMVAQGLQLITSAILLASGIGLIQGKSYGRFLAIIYAVATMVLTVAVLIANVIFLFIPVFARAAEAAEGPEKVALMAGGAMGAVCAFCPFIYPTLLLIFVNRAPIVNYLKAQNNQ